MRAVFVLVMMAACGRVGFDDRGDGGDGGDGVVVVDTSGDGGGNFTVVNAVGSIGGTGTMVDVSTGVPTQAGTLLVIAINDEDGTTTTIDSVAAGGVAMTDAGADSMDTNCDNTVELWYVANNPGGLTTVTVTMSSTAGIEAWILEIGGVTQVEGALALNNGVTAPTAVAPSVTTTGAAVVISAVANCVNVTGLVAGDAFTALPIENGEDTAYEIVGAAGSYGAAWDYTGGTYNASTVAFR